MTEIRMIGPLSQYGANVYSLDDFTSSFNIGDLSIGSFVASDVIEHLRNNLPPVTDWSTLFQPGGSVCDRYDGTQLRPAYHTFTTSAGLPYWEYRGSCFKGETKQRGQIPVWQR